jgi:PAS domain S-box-containing protein
MANINKQITADHSVWRLFLILISSIVLVEITIMVILAVLPPLSMWMTVVLDVVMLSICILPLMYLFVFRPLIGLLAERTQAGVLLHESEEKFKNAFQYSAIGMALVSPEGKWIKVNSKVCGIVGYSEAELMSKTFQDITHPDDLNADLNFVAQMLAGEIETYTIEKRYFHKNGSVVWVLLAVSLVKEPAGTPLYFISQINDITERKQTEEQLLANNNLFTQFVQHSPVYTYIKDVTETSSIVIQCSDNFQTMVGISRNEMIGKDMTEVFPAEFAASIIADDWSVVSNGGVIRKDEELNGRSFTTIKYPIIQQGKTYLAGYTIDITEQRQGENAIRESEERMRALIGQAPIGIGLSRDGLTLDANPAYLAMFGYEHIDELRERPLINQIAPQCRDEVMHRIQKRAAGVNVENMYETIGLRKDGSQFPFLVSVTRIILADGPLTVSFFTDITDQRKSAEALRDNEEKYRGLVENSPDAIAIYVAGIIVFVNNECVRLMAAKDKKDLIGKPVIEFVHPESRPTVIRRMKEVMIDGMPLQTEEERFIRCDGTTVDVEVKAIPAVYEHQPAVQIIVHDVSERKKAEESLRESEEKFRNVFEHSVEGKSLTKLNGLMKVNNAYCHILGYSELELSKVPWSELTHPDDMERDQRILDSIISGEKAEARWEKRYFHKNGSIVWTDIGTVLKRDSAGKPLYFITSINDITVRKDAEKALIESEKKFRDLVETSQELIWKCDAEGRFTYLNPAWETTHGYKVEEMLGKNFGTFQRPEVCERDKKLFFRRLSGGSIRGYETSHLTKEGKERTLIFNANPLFDGKGNIVGTQGTATDITDRKKTEIALRESEELLKMVIQNSSDLTTLSDEHDNLIFIGPQSENVLGMAGETFLGKKMLYTIHPEDREKCILSWTELKKNRTEINNIEYRIIDGDGSIRWVSHTARNVNVEGRMLGIQSTISNITERKKSEQALRNAQKMESIGTLAGGIAHDFNNLLNAILGQSSLALGKLSKESPAAGNIMKAIKASEHAADLTRQLLAYSGRGKFFTEEINLNNLIKENIQMLEVSIPKTAQLRYELDSSSPRIIGDISQIQQVIMNLIINAGEAMDPNPGTIILHTGEIELTESDMEYWKYTNTPLVPDRYAIVKVKDTGCGISQETLARIFDPFFTTKFTGRGLGLAAVLGIIKGHKGALRIESEVGKGTLFEVVLPLASTAASSIVPVEMEHSVVDGKGKTILIIDDDPFVFELLEDILTEVRFSVTGALNPLKGIEIYQQNHKNIDLVILDYSMPEMDGRGAFEELRKINSEVKVILCSGYTEEETMSAFGAVQPVGFFQKPYKTEAVLERVIEILSAKRPVTRSL